MRSFQITVFMLAVFILTMQLFRHTYVRFIEDTRSSVLDKFEQTESQETIKGAQSLNDLAKEYALAKTQLDELNIVIQKEEATLTKEALIAFRTSHDKEHDKLSDLTADLKKAILVWEAKNKEIYDMRVFWLLGFAFALIGTLFVISGRAWLGMSFIIPGIVEMICWTCPSFGIAGSSLEFELLLTNKLILTLVTLLLIIITWTRNENVLRKKMSKT